MTTSILICDDSSFARRQMARSIPDDWDVSITFAENGAEGLEVIRAGKADLTFLDLNMPVMDGYETMQIIKDDELSTMVIVVSGDVQENAKRRMLEMGAIDFIRKPIDIDKLLKTLTEYGIFSGDAVPQKQEDELESIDKLDVYREIANVAMGQAGEQLAKLFGLFIKLPIPNVNVLETNELHMAIAEINHNESVSAVSQGFLAMGINGEAFVIFNDSNMASLVDLLKYQSHQVNDELELEALIDVSNILIGTCLNALSEQLHVKFSLTHPILLGRHLDLDQMLESNVSRWNKIVAIEIGYSVEDHDIHFDLLLLFPNSAMDVVYEKLVSVTE
jgi:chemotaxis protein CheY-P-specific phosphatase CheC